jgi:hypothetical protein
MRFLSIILLACIIFLSSFGGTLKPVQPKKMDNCCKKMAKEACNHKPADKKNANDGCDRSSCAMIFSCSICGFFIKEPLAINPPFSKTILKPVAHYITGDLADYHANNWKPPKTC